MFNLGNLEKRFKRYQLLDIDAFVKLLYISLDYLSKEIQLHATSRFTHICLIWYTICIIYIVKGVVKMTIKRNISRTSISVLISLGLHLIALMLMVFYPQGDRSKIDESLLVNWVKDIPEPKLKLEQLRDLLKMKKYEPKHREDRRHDNKLSRSSNNEITEVVKYSERILTKSVGVVDREKAEFVPDIMTDAKLREAEGSNISRMVSLGGRTDGRGIVTGRAVAKGRGRGSSLIDAIGEGGAGDGGGSLIDKLDIIKFLSEKEGPQRIVYCLDVSASMSAAGLNKLGLAIDALKDSMLMLKEHDEFNIITFSQKAKSLYDDMKTANTENLQDAFKYLNRFMPETISKNLGTNLLEAMLLAFESKPTAVILITDGIPVAYDSKQYYIETDPNKILQKIKEKNVQNASIYVVGLEIDLKRSFGSYLLVALANQNNGKLKLINRDKLAEFATDYYY